MTQLYNGFSRGDVRVHPEHGAIVITEGPYKRIYPDNSVTFDDYWCWREVGEDGTLGERHQGESGPWPLIEGASLVVIERVEFGGKPPRITSPSNK